MMTKNPASVRNYSLADKTSLNFKLNTHANNEPFINIHVC